MMRQIILIFGFLVLCLAFPTVLAAQQSSEKRTQQLVGEQKQLLRFGRLDITDGLSQGMIFCMFQDSRGFMWFGTKEGLNRFDGYDFLSYRKRPGDTTSLPDNYVMAITEDTRGRLWLGTLSEGLVMFDPSTEVFTKVRIPHERGTDRVRPVDDVEVDGNGLLWVAVHGMKLFSLDTRLSDVAAIQASMNPAGPYLKFDSKEVERLRYDRLGRLMYLTDESLYVYDSGHGTWDLLVRHQSLFGSERNTTGFMFSATQSDSTIWVAVTINGCTHLRRLSPDGQRVLERRIVLVEGREQHIRDMIEGSDGAMYMISHEFFMRLDPRTGTLLYSSAQRDHMAGYLGWGHHLGVSRDGVLWIGTSGYGLNTFNPLTLVFNAHHERIHPALFAREMEAFDRSIRERTDGAMRLVNDIFPRRMPDGSLWCGTVDHGLLHWDARTGRIRHYGVNGNDLYSFLMVRVHRPFVDSRGRVWVGNRHGISRLTDSPEQWEHYWFAPDGPDLTGADSRTTCWYEDPEGMIWLGTISSGMARFDPDSGTFTFYQYDADDSTSLSHDHVLSIEPDPDYPEHWLWVGTDGGGLNRFDLRSGRFTQYGAMQGLTNPVVYGILPDEQGMLWMSTNEGLFRFNPRSEHFRQYDVRDGLQDNEFNRAEYYRIGDSLCFGGVNGYNIFDPSEIRINSTIPPIVFTGFRLFDTEINPAAPDSPLSAAIPYVQSIDLAHDQNMFTIEFSSLDYHAPDRNRYRYRLEGFTSGWIDAGTTRSATFTNLDPGEYVFHVIGSNNHGTWNKEGATVRIVIHPPWWMTGWAFALYSIVIIGTLLGVDRLQRRRLITRERERAQYREAKLRAETAELEARVARAENERKQKEMQVASVIQQRVLPQELPRIRGYDIAGINLPADEIGGDYFDCIPLRNGRVAFVVADVTGKGVPASLLVNSLHAALRVHLDNDEDIPDLVRRLNAFLYRSTPASAFITFLIAVLDPDTGRIEVINAGHNPALIHRNGSVTDTERSRHLPLGCTIGAQGYTSERYSIGEGEGMLLYTDGITEAMNTERVPFGQEALENLVMSHRGKPAALLLGNVVSELRYYAGGAEQSDDITALYIRRSVQAEVSRETDTGKHVTETDRSRRG